MKNLIEKNTLIDIEQAINNICEKRDILVIEKQALDLELSTLNSRVRSSTEFLPKNDYDSICRKQVTIKSRKNQIEKELSEYKKELRNKNLLKDKVKSEIITQPSIGMHSELILLKDKYMEFSSDQSRVSSMRIMASKFAEELQLIINNF